MGLCQANMVAFNSSTGEAGFQASQGHLVRPCLGNKQQTLKPKQQQIGISLVTLRWQTVLQEAFRCLLKQFSSVESGGLVLASVFSE